MKLHYSDSEGIWIDLDQPTGDEYEYVELVLPDDINDELERLVEERDNWRRHADERGRALLDLIERFCTCGKHDLYMVEAHASDCYFRIGRAAALPAPPGEEENDD